MSEERIRNLPCWSGPVDLTTLEGGITNRNYIVQDGSTRYVARTGDELPHLGIDRRNEIECQGFASELGLAPAIRYHEPGVLVSDFVEGITLSADLVRAGDRLERVAGTLRSLHDACDGLRGVMLFFCPFQTVETYAATARGIGGQLPPDVDVLLADARELHRRMSPYVPTLCHNDLLPANFIECEDVQKVWLVDWEYAGVGNPLFDLSGLSANCGLDREEEVRLLTAYQGEASETTLTELGILKTVSLLREALWAVIQEVKSDIEFDYVKYRDDNLDAYRTARAALG